jgi:hypothetical protein
MKTRSRQVFLERRHANRAKRVRHTVARALGELGSFQSAAASTIHLGTSSSTRSNLRSGGSAAIPCSGGYERRPAAYFAQRKPAAEASPMLFGAPF